MPLQIIRQDITKMRVDAIVNTTNEEMIGYSGVDLAVHEGAGPELDAECARIAPLGLGTAKMTAGYDLPAKYIIHTSGPVWHGGLLGESIILRSCYIESLKLAVENGLESVAFPLISSGAYGYPKEQVLKFAIQVITGFLDEHELDIYLCVFDRTSYQFSQELFDEISEFIDDEYAEEQEEETLRYAAFFSVPFDFDDDVSDECCASAPPPPMQKMMAPQVLCNSAAGKSLHEYMETKEKSFGWKLFELIDKSGMTDVECYKKANVDKKTFSKIKCNPDTYKPSKPTAVAFAIALKLDLDETQELLATAGLTLSKSFVFDKIICYFIQKGNYNIFEINEALFEFDQVLLGC